MKVKQVRSNSLYFEKMSLYPMIIQIHFCSIANIFYTLFLQLKPIRDAVEQLHVSLDVVELGDFGGGVAE